MVAHAALLVLGLLGLWLGSVLAVNGGRNVALHLRLSPAFVGLTLLSVGTSVPEIAVSVAAGVDRLRGLDASGISVGTCVGSAINQLSVLLGVVAILAPLRIRPARLRREGIVLVGAIVAIWTLSLDGRLSRLEGWAMMATYAGYVVLLTRVERTTEPRPGPRPLLHVAIDALRLVGGLLLVGFASHAVVRNAVSLATAAGWSQAFIGIFLVGLGTGLPELAVSLAAIRRGEREMSISNLLGSNVCDLLFSLGAGVAVGGFTVPAPVRRVDLPALLLLTLCVLALLRRGFRLRRGEGLALVGAYVAYVVGRFLLLG